MENRQWLGGIHTGYLLFAIASNSANDGILLAAEAVERTLGVSLGPSGIVFSLAGSVFLLARVGPRLGPGHVAHGLDNGTLEGVVLPGGFAIREMSAGCVSQGRLLKETYEGSVLLVDMSKKKRLVYERERVRC
jgi:hypothetical protein